MAFRLGEDTEEAEVGALLVADALYCLRLVRDFLTNVPREPTRGFYFGSDMWVWGRTFLGRGAPQLEIDKHWLHFLLWGRLGYDPTVDDDRIAAAYFGQSAWPS